MRVPVIRTDADGSTHRGTAMLFLDPEGGEHLTDFRDGAGDPFELPPGSRFEAAIPVTEVHPEG